MPQSIGITSTPHSRHIGHLLFPFVALTPSSHPRPVASKRTILLPSRHRYSTTRRFYLSGPLACFHNASPLHHNRPRFPPALVHLRLFSPRLSRLASPRLVLVLRFPVRSVARLWTVHKAFFCFLRMPLALLFASACCNERRLSPPFIPTSLSACSPFCADGRAELDR